MASLHASTHGRTTQFVWRMGPNVLASRYDYASPVAMICICILSYGNTHQPIRVRHTLMAKELDGARHAPG